MVGDIVVGSTVVVVVVGATVVIGSSGNRKYSKTSPIVQRKTESTALEVVQDFSESPKEYNNIIELLTQSIYSRLFDTCSLFMGLAFCQSKSK